MGFIALAAFLVCGLAAAEGLFYEKSRMTRIYLGLVTGLFMMMWLPCVYAFAFDFTMQAQWLALLTAAFLGALACLLGRRGRVRAARQDGDMPWQMLLLIVPFLLFSLYLLHTHTLKPENGALHVGQSTYGDLSLHLGIATGLRGASYPPEYTLLPGTMLGYPFLSDAMVTTMLLFGASLRWAFIVTAALMMGLVYWGFMLLCWELTRSKMAVIIAFFLLFLNGGLGFMYTFDGVFKDSSRLYAALFDFYQAPTNMPDLNLRWVNVIADLMIPQRTLLAGWTVTIPALLLLAQAMHGGRRRDYWILGAWSGLIPMVHTHSFLALGLIGMGAMVYWLIHSADRREALIRYLIFGGAALALALPQLLRWTFPQTVGGGSLAFRFNWVNNQQGLIDGWLWFWVKNVGPVFLLLVPAALSGGRRIRALAVGALFVFIAAELIQFQPNPYDNNKLFYVAFILMLPAVARYIVRIYQKLQGVRARAWLLGCFMAVSTLSGAVTLAREAISDYELFSPSAVSAAAHVDQYASADAVFLTGDQHNNPIAALSGRKLVCGTGAFLYYHGVDYTTQQASAIDMYESPESSGRLFDKYGVDYVYISSYERASYAIDESFFEEHFDLWYENDGVKIYSVPLLAGELWN